MNKCNVKFVCCGTLSTCEFAGQNSTDYKCAYYEQGYCTSTAAQIQALQDEGFEIKED